MFKEEIFGQDVLVTQSVDKYCRLSLSFHQFNLFRKRKSFTMMKNKLKESISDSERERAKERGRKREGKRERAKERGRKREGDKGA